MILNLDNDEKRQLVEHCYRTQKVLINPLINWDDEYLWWYIRHEGIEINPLYSCGWDRVGCIGCPMAGKHRAWEFERYPAYKRLYIKAFGRMLIERERAGLKNLSYWTDAEAVFRWWMEDKSNPDQITIDQWLHEIGADNVPTVD